MAKPKPISLEIDCPECGSIFDWMPHGDQKPRSPDQLRRFHLMTTLAFRAWPESHGKSFNNKEECRKWLTMKAGPEYRVVRATLSLEGMDKRQAMQVARFAVQTAREYQVAQLEGTNLVIYEAKSVAVLTMGHRAFNLLNTLVSDVIKTEAGLDVDTLIADHFRLKAEMGLHEKKPAPRYSEPRDF